MKNRPLSIQIWIVFAIITLVISLVSAIVLPMTLRGFFTQEIYSTIDSAQDLILNRFNIEDFWSDKVNGKNPNALEDIRSVKHILIYGDNQIILDSPVSLDFINQIKNSLSKQNIDKDYYKGNLDSEKVLYVITKGNSFGRDAYLISYMGDAYRQDLVTTLFKRLILVIGIIFLLSWIPALILSRYLSKPLVQLESRVGKLANNDWWEPIDLNRSDEIGKLGDSVEELRKQLIEKNKLEQRFLQNISHELKTPVMVIRSFSQAIKDGIFPKGNLDNSIEVIDSEAERLEKKITNLLYFSKLDYMENHESKNSVFSINSLINDVVNRLSWSRRDISWDIDLSPLDIMGDWEQWKIVLENLIDNQIRYADKEISIKLTKIDNQDILSIWNDGPHIEPEVMKNIFLEYNKGYKGEFGLGLAIVNRILKIHNSTIVAENKDKGVEFRIQINNH